MMNSTLKLYKYLKIRDDVETISGASFGPRCLIKMYRLNIILKLYRVVVYDELPVEKLRELEEDDRCLHFIEARHTIPIETYKLHIFLLKKEYEKVRLNPYLAYKFDDGSFMIFMGGGKVREPYISFITSNFGTGLFIVQKRKTWYSKRERLAGIVEKDVVPVRDMEFPMKRVRGRVRSIRELKLRVS